MVISNKVENKIRGTRHSISIWHIGMPSDVSRGDYIRNCLNTNTVTIKNNNGESLNEIKIGRLAIQMVRFPKNKDTVGSPVSVGNEPYHNLPIVLDVYTSPDEYDNLEENAWKFKKKTATGKGEIFIRGKKGQIIMSVSGTETDSGKIILDIINDSGSGELDINIKGTASIEATKVITIKSNTSIVQDVDEPDDTANSENFRTTYTQGLDGFTMKIFEDDSEKSDPLTATITYKLGVGFSYTDEFGNSLIMDKDKIKIDSIANVLNLGDGTEKIILGDSWATFMKDFIAEVAKSTTPMGSLLNASLIAAFSAKVDALLSQYSNTE